MTDFSAEPDQVLAANLAQGYVGMHFQQGVPILDRDLNLLQDLTAATVRRILGQFLGSGVAPVAVANNPAANDAFQVKAVADPNQDNDFVISAGSAPPGRALVDGMEAMIMADMAYSAQSSDVLQSPASDTRTDTVYLDVFLAVDESGTVMDNSVDVAVQTSVRLRPTWVVRVAVGAGLPGPEAGHGHLPLAKIARTAGQKHIEATAITDLRPLLFSATALRRILLDPVVTLDTDVVNAGTSLTIPGRNFPIFPGDKVTVLFGTTPAPPPKVNSPAMMPQEVLVTVHTPYGSTTSPRTIQILPPH
jgi:hypothetical protein